MNEQQLELTRLIGKKELSFWCYVVNKEMPSFYYKLITKVYFPWDTNENRWWVVNTNNNSVIEQTIPEEQFEIVWHTAHLPDFHKWMNEKIKKVSDWHFSQWPDEIRFCLAWRDEIKVFEFDITIPYDSSKDLLDQSTETLDKIIELIKSNS